MGVSAVVVLLIITGKNNWTVALNNPFLSTATSTLFSHGE
jgi:hypothetical protein